METYISDNRLSHLASSTFNLCNSHCHK